MSVAVILLHGFTHTGASWEPVLAALGERYRALAPDIRGHGRASSRRPVDLAGVLEDLGALAPESFVLGGYSMGGRIALHLALALPERVQRLVLIGASPGIEDDAERATRRRYDEALAFRIETMTIAEFAEHWAGATQVLADQPAHVRERARRDRLRNSPAGLAAALRGLGAGVLSPVWDRLEELTMPVALITGERDHKFTAIAREMAERLPDAELQIVPGAGHAVHLETPARVAELLHTARGEGY